MNLFLLENSHTGELLKELGDKFKLASENLEETAKAYEQTKTEYEELERELEDLNGRMDALREQTQENALRKQQLEGQINVLNEQILAGVQNEEHYNTRLAAIEEELSRRLKERTELEKERAEIRSSLKTVREKLGEQEEQLTQVQENIRQCTEAVEDGKNEIIEILNARATTKGKVQRFDTMMEQADIRKAEISQRILRLKSEEEEQHTILRKVRAEHDSITKL